MDAQLKRGLIEVCVLAMLRRGDSYGYQLIKDVSALIAVSESTLYPILRRLETAEYLTVYTMEHNSRLRKYYAITDKGVRRIQDFLQEWAELDQVLAFIKEGAGHDAQ
ncbi:MAG: PadR family transcriptional regulator [Clostridiales bacterium]|nr:PadR family transcriptional regulator [Clostridiales bacterium]